MSENKTARDELRVRFKNRSVFCHRSADCPNCGEMAMMGGLGWTQVAKNINECDICEGTVRDPIPWTELFTTGWGVKR